MVKYNVLSYIVLDAVFSNKYIVTVSSACPVLATDVFARWFSTGPAQGIYGGTFKRPFYSSLNFYCPANSYKQFMRHDTAWLASLLRTHC